jgi:hypothetical protein
MKMTSSQGRYYIAVVLDFWFSNYWYTSFILKLSTRSYMTSNKISAVDTSSVLDLDLQLFVLSDPDLKVGATDLDHNFKLNAAVFN